MSSTADSDPSTRGQMAVVTLESSRTKGPTLLWMDPDSVVMASGTGTTPSAMLTSKTSGPASGASATIPSNKLTCKMPF